jgi:hypothetical protein
MAYFVALFECYTKGSTKHPNGGATTGILYLIVLFEK